MDGTSAATATMPGKVGRASRTLGQLWQVPTLALGLLAFGLVAATAPMRQDQAARSFDTDCEYLRQICKEQGEIGETIPLVESVLERADAYPAKAGLAHFLAGCVYQRLGEEEAKSGSAEQATAAWNRALTLLETAQSLGVPPEDAAALLLRLGQVLFDANTDLPRALDLLARAAESGIEQPAHVYRLLVEGNLRLPVPNLESALAFSQKQLEYTEADSEIWEARLLRGTLLVRQGKYAEAIQEWELIPFSAAASVRLAALLLQAQCYQHENQWSRAIPLWQELRKHTAEVSGSEGRVLYNLGLCYQNADPPDERQARELWTRAVALGGEEGQAAGLRLGERYLLGEPSDPGKGLAEWTHSLLKVRHVADFKNDLIGLDQIRCFFEAAWQKCQGQQDYRLAEELAQLYKKIAGPGIADERLASSLDGHAHELLTRAQENGQSTFQEIQPVFAEAASAYEAAAAARNNPIDQSSLLERAAACWLQAKEFARAVAVLQRFVQITNQSDDVLAEAYLRLADAFYALSNAADARAALYKCIEYPTAVAYRARYRLALEAIDGNDLEQAEMLLKQNLTVTGPMLDQQAREKSIYRLAELLYQRQSYDEAAVFLKEAIRQYPQNPLAYVARDELGYCYRVLGGEISKKLMERVLSEEVKAHYVRDRRDRFEEAIRTYQSLADELEKLSAVRGTLTTADQGLLRKARFALADLAFERNDLLDALRRYQALLDAYRGQWDGIYACQRTFECAKFLQTTNERQRTLATEATRRAITKTLIDVNGMKDDHEAFRGPNRPTRQQWLDWLRRMETQLNAVSPAPAATRPGQPR